MRILSVLLLSLSLSLAQAPQAMAQQVEFKDGLVVQGQGDAEAMPDALTVSASVEETASTAQALRTRLGDRAQALITAIKSLNFARMEVTTTNFSVYPIYPSSEGRRPSKPTGYRGNVSVNIMVKNVPANDLAVYAARIADVALINGADNVHAPQFYLDNQKPVSQEALQEAIENAKETAQLAARAAGVTLGPLQTMTVGPAPMYRVPRMAPMGGVAYAEAAAMKQEISADVFQIAPIEVTREVTLQYKLVP